MSSEAEFVELLKYLWLMPQHELVHGMQTLQSMLMLMLGTLLQTFQIIIDSSLMLLLIDIYFSLQEKLLVE
jgi:hypothetical protein